MLKDVARGDEVLDLCCGTGQFAARLVKLGYRVIGIDSSKGMLDIARNREGEAEFIQCTAQSFSSGRAFDAGCFLYDSLNHMLSILQCFYKS